MQACAFGCWMKECSSRAEDSAPGVGRGLREITHERVRQSGQRPKVQALGDNGVVCQKVKRLGSVVAAYDA